MAPNIPLAPGWRGETNRARAAYKKLLDAQEESPYNCKDRTEEFVDYGEPPTDEEAQEMCFGCPLRKVCGDYAQAANVTWGVWNGEVRDIE